MTIQEHMSRLIELAKENATPYTSLILDSDGQIIAMAPNRVKQEHNATSHAEMNAIEEASARSNSADLGGCHLITTCEPCPMCAAAIYWSGIRQVTWGLSIPEIQKAGHRQLNLRMNEVLSGELDKMIIKEGVMGDDVLALFSK